MGYYELNANIGRKSAKIRDAAREFGREVLRPAGIELDRISDPAKVIARNSRLWEVFRQAREQGFHKLMIPRAFGGLMGKAPDNAPALVAEEMGYADSGLAISMEVSSMPFAFASLSADAGVRNWARDYAEDKGANLVGCWAITEPDHGTDWVLGVTDEGANPQTAPSLRAVKKGDEFILNGRKAAWVTNGTIATHAVIHVGLDAARGMHGSGIAMCPLDLPGISRGKPLDKIGQRPLNQGEVIFEDVKLPKKYMLVGSPGIFAGNLFGSTFLGVVNSQMGLTFSGLSRALFDESLRHARETIVDGAPLFEKQAVRLRLFQMFTAAESARLFAHSVVEAMFSGRANPAVRAVSSMFMASRATFWGIGKGIEQSVRLWTIYHDHPKVLALIAKRARVRKEGGLADWGKYGVASKVLATETSFKNALEAMRIFGGQAALADLPIEKMFRDARASTIEDGANEALSLAAAKTL